jgi:hypothetical protein
MPGATASCTKHCKCVLLWRGCVVTLCPSYLDGPHRGLQLATPPALQLLRQAALKYRGALSLHGPLEPHPAVHTLPYRLRYNLSVALARSMLPDDGRHTLSQVEGLLRPLRSALEVVLVLSGVCCGCSDSLQADAHWLPLIGVAEGLFARLSNSLELQPVPPALLTLWAQVYVVFGCVGGCGCLVVSVVFGCWLLWLLGGLHNVGCVGGCGFLVVLVCRTRVFQWGCSLYYYEGLIRRTETMTGCCLL